MPVRELTDAEVFGTVPPPGGARQELSDAEVFGDYQPTLIPLKRGADGKLEFTVPQIAKDMWAGIEAPANAYREPLNMDRLMKGARDTTAMIAGGGSFVSAAPKLGAEAGSLAMNALPPLQKAARAVGEAATTVAQPVLSRMDPDGTIGQMLAKRLLQQNPGMTLEQAVAASQQKLAELGPEAVLADLGESTKRLARNMAQAPGDTAQFAKTTLGARQEAEKTRMIDSIRKNVSDDGFYDEDAAHKASMKEAGPHYEAAYEQHPNVTSEGLQLLLDQEPLVKQGINKGLELQRIEASTARQPFQPEKYGVVADFAEDGSPIITEVNATPLRLWHAAREGLDAMLEQYRDPMTGKLNLDKRGKRINDLRQSLSTEIKDLTGGDAGEFAQGDKVYASAAKLNEALYKGRAFARGDEEITAKVFKSFTPDQQKAYLSGVAQEMVATIRRNHSSDLTPAQIMSVVKRESNTHLKLKEFLPERQFNDLLGDVQRRLTFRDTARGIQNVSQTGSIAMEEGEIAGDTLSTLGSAGADALKGRSGAAFAKAMGWALGQLRRAQMPQQARDKIGRLLLSQDQADKEEAFRLIQQVQQSGRLGP